MTKTFGMTAAAAMIAAAGTASAAPFTHPGHDRAPNLLSADQYTITAEPIDGAATRGPADVRFSAMDLNTNNIFSLTATGGGQVGFDDYQTDNVGSSATTTLAFHRFVGGVGAPGGVLFFTFFDSVGNFVDSYGVQLGSAGNFIYTITIGTPFAIPTDGIAIMWADDGSVVTATDGTWFLTDIAPNPGTSSSTFGGATNGGVPLYHMHEIEEVPAPASLALLGLGGAFAARRRR